MTELRTAMLKTLDELEVADAKLADAALTLRDQVQRFRSHIESGGSVSDPVILDPLAARRAMISTALTDLERARHTSQQALYQLARAEGMSVSDIARACGVSRQLVSRSLKE